MRLLLRAEKQAQTTRQHTNLTTNLFRVKENLLLLTPAPRQANNERERERTRNCDYFCFGVQQQLTTTTTMTRMTTMTSPIIITNNQHFDSKKTKQQLNPTTIIWKKTQNTKKIFYTFFVTTCELFCPHPKCANYYFFCG